MTIYILPITRRTLVAQGEFTKEEAAETQTAVEEIFKALSKPKQREYFGHMNDISLFLTAAGNAAPPPEG